MKTNAQIQLQLTASDYNGYNISCFGVKDGAINLTITGGYPPYSIVWSNAATTEDISDLPSGYYRVEVTDDSLNFASAEITLIEPEALRINLTYSAYYVNGREYNISLNGACNGWITVNPTGGVEPYSYHWEQLNGSNQQTVSNLCALEYLVQVTDANGCMQENIKIMKEPERDDWTMSGNSGTNDNHFIGTTDEAGLVFKTNSEERMRIEADGNILINRFSGGAGMAYFDSLGRMQSGFTNAPCNNVQTMWETSLTPFLIYTCSPNRVAIGHYAIPSSARFYVDGQTHLDGNLGVGMAASNGTVRLSVSGVSYLDGAVGIGMMPQSGYSLTVDGKVGVREVYVRATGAWPDYVFDKDYKLMPLCEVKRFIKKHGHLPGMFPAHEIETTGQPVGQIQNRQQQHIEQLYLHIFELEKRLAQLEKKRKK